MSLEIPGPVFTLSVRLVDGFAVDLRPGCVRTLEVLIDIVHKHHQTRASRAYATR